VVPKTEFKHQGPSKKGNDGSPKTREQNQRKSFQKATGQKKFQDEWDFGKQKGLQRPNQNCDAIGARIEKFQLRERDDSRAKREEKKIITFSVRSETVKSSKGSLGTGGETGKRKGEKLNLSKKSLERGEGGNSYGRNIHVG